MSASDSRGLREKGWAEREAEDGLDVELAEGSLGHGGCGRVVG
jgi:hypothetical protein